MTNGIICEYNPFHKGHLYHIQSTLAHTDGAPIICVMSGHYVQRGEPALLDKWTRTRMALAAGAALVLELPTYYSTATAEWFSYGAISLLKHTGLVDTLSFGLEDPTKLPALQAVTAHLQPESPAYQALLQQNLTDTASFAQARAKAISELAGVSLPLQSPNTILVLEYLKALRSLSWNPKLLPVKRQSSGYHDLSTEALYPSASAIRRQAAAGRSILPYLPDCSLAYLPSPYVLPEDLMSPLSYALCFHTPETLADVDEVNEGLENRILAIANCYPSYSDLLQQLKTKRYPTSRLRRVLLNILLGITKTRKNALSFTDGPAYLRVLGFRKDQEAVLSHLTRTADLPVITNLPKQLSQLPMRAQEMLKDELRFSRIYAASHPDLQRDSEFRQPIIVL